MITTTFIIQQSLELLVATVILHERFANIDTVLFRRIHNGIHKVHPACARSSGRRLRFVLFHIPAHRFRTNPTSSAQCDGPRTQVQNQGDITALASCQKLTGDLIISENAAGTLNIAGIREITGNLVCQNAGALTSISSPDLQTLGGTFGLANLTILSTLQMDSLTSVNEIQWIGLPALQSLSFRRGITTANKVLVSNTQLASLSGIELETVGTMNINNNNYLSTVNVNNLANVTESLSFAANARDLQISFPNLESAANLTFRNASSVTCPSLSQVNGSMGFYSNTFMSFSAPNLTATGGSLAFVDSSNLNNLSFPRLTQVGGAFLIANNTDLKSINGFPALAVIVGALDFSGSFDK